MSDPPLCAGPDPDPRPPRHRIPDGACDCHFHVFDEPSPQVAERSYSAPRASLDDFRRLQSALGTQRSVIVQPSIYGTDNRTTLQSMPDDESMRAIVVVDDDASASQLKRYADQGAVGVRVNLLFSSNARLAQLSGLAKKVADLGWHVQVLADVSTLPNLSEFMASIPCPVVFDHMGHVNVGKGIEDPGFQSLLRYLESGKAWVKMSGAYRVTSSMDGNYDDVAGMARALVAANPDHLVWGSDWPHPSFNGPMPNDGYLLDLLFDWADEATAHKILVDNPQRLYGFSPLGDGNEQSAIS